MIQLRKSSQLKVEMPLISSILLEKCGSLISGQLGVHHAKHQWHTIRQCLIKEELIGATKLRSFASVLIKLPRLLLSMLRLRDGRSQFTITELNLIAVHNTQWEVFQMLCLLTLKERLFSKDIQPTDKILRQILTHFSKVRRSLDLVQRKRTSLPLKVKQPMVERALSTQLTVYQTLIASKVNMHQHYKLILKNLPKKCQELSVSWFTRRNTMSTPENQVLIGRTTVY